MKKVFAILSASAILLTAGFAGGCAKKEAEDVFSTEAPITEVFRNDKVDEEDMALPVIQNNESTTAPVTSATSAPAPTQPTSTGTTASDTTTSAAPTSTTPTATQPSTTTTKPAATTTTKPTTTTTTAPTTAKPAGTAELLNKSVLPVIKSGTYTMVVSGFTKDKSPDDKLYKFVRGGETAYYITIPYAKLSFRVFPNDGKYYLATNSKYCEITKEQYNKICTSFSHVICDFNALNYKKTEDVREGVQKYTCEYFDVSGTEVVLWYKSNSLFRMHLETDLGPETLSVSVSGGADSGYFNLSDNLEQAEYSTMESLVSSVGIFFG